MSDHSRDWGFYVRDMLGFAGRVLEYTGGLNRDSFVQNQLVYDATVRNIELIGEAATHIPAEVRSDHDKVQWRAIIATRNKLIHGYLGLDDDVIWSIICDDIPDLVDELKRILDGLD